VREPVRSVLLLGLSGSLSGRNVLLRYWLRVKIEEKELQIELLLNPLN
jgi:hypothetical protein